MVTDLLDGFEDTDFSSWSGDTGALSQNNDPFVGSHAASLAVDTGSVSVTRSDFSSEGEVGAAFKRSGSDVTEIVWKAGGTAILRVKTDTSSGNITFNGTTLGAEEGAFGYEDFTITPDFGAETADISLTTRDQFGNSSTFTATDVAFLASASQIDAVTLSVTTSFDAESQFDELRFEPISPAAPTLDTVSLTNGDQFDVAWTDNSTIEDGFDIEVSTDGGSSWSVDGSVGADTTSYTTTEQRDGEVVAVRVVATNGSKRAASGSQSGQTNLPAVANLAFDASTEDELTALWDDTQDYGNYELQIRESDTTTWSSTVTEPETDTSHTFGGLKDGEKYDVRLRGATEHTTTVWLERSEVTLLPAPTNFAIGETSPRLGSPASMSWTDNAENAEGNYAVFISTDGGSTFTEVDSISESAESYDYISTEPDTTHTAKVEFQTKYVTAESNTDTFLSGLEASDGAWVGLRKGTSQRKLASDLVHLNIIREHSGLSDWVVKTAYDESLESWRLSEAWLYNGDEFLLRGELQPIESDDSALITEARGYDELIELDRTDVEVQYQNIEAWEALEDFIDTKLPFDADVTEPSTTTRSTTLQDVDGASELQAAAVSTTVTDPIEFDTGTDKLTQVPTGWVLECEDGSNTFSGTGSGTVLDQSLYSGGGAVDTGSDPSVGEHVDMPWTTEYEIEAGDLALEVHMQIPGGDNSDFSVQIKPEGAGSFTTIASFTNSQLTGNESEADYLNADNNIGNLGTIPVGTHTVRIEIESTGPAGDRQYFDCVGIVDTRFGPDGNFDETVTDGIIEGPPKYAQGVQVYFERSSGSDNLTAATVDSTWSEVGDIEIGVEFEPGSGYAFKTDTASASFSNTGAPTTGLQVQAVLNADTKSLANTSESPRKQNEPAALFEFTVTGEGNTRGVIESQTFVGKAYDVFQDLRERAGVWSVMEYAEAGASTIAAFKPGDVTGSVEFDVADGGRTRTLDPRDYRNRVIARGPKDQNGDRLTVKVPEDPASDPEIQALAAELGRSIEGATFERSIIRPDLTNKEELKSVARTLRDQLVDEDDLTGRLEIVPLMTDPGKAYSIPAWGVTIPSQRVVYDLGQDGLRGALVFDEPDGLGLDVDEVASREQETRDSI